MARLLRGDIVAWFIRIGAAAGVSEKSVHLSAVVTTATKHRGERPTNQPTEQCREIEMTLLKLAPRVCSGKRRKMAEPRLGRETGLRAAPRES